MTTLNEDLLKVVYYDSNQKTVLVTNVVIKVEKAGFHKVFPMQTDGSGLLSPLPLLPQLSTADVF